MTKTEFLSLLRTEHAEWEALLAEIPAARMIVPGVAGDDKWSVKDLIAHVAWYQREMVGVLRAHALVGSELWGLPLDEQNAAIYEQNRQRPLDDVFTEARQVFHQLVDAVEAIAEEDLLDPSRFPGMETNWVPWKVIAENSYLHEREHTQQVRAWLDQSKRS